LDSKYRQAAEAKDVPSDVADREKGLGRAAQRRRQSEGLGDIVGLQPQELGQLLADTAISVGIRRQPFAQGEGGDGEEGGDGDGDEDEEAAAAEVGQQEHLDDDDDDDDDDEEDDEGDSDQGSDHGNVANAGRPRRAGRRPARFREDEAKVEDLSCLVEASEMTASAAEDANLKSSRCAIAAHEAWQAAITRVDAAVAHLEGKDRPRMQAHVRDKAQELIREHEAGRAPFAVHASVEAGTAVGLAAKAFRLKVDQDAYGDACRAARKICEAGADRARYTRRYNKHKDAISGRRHAEAAAARAAAVAAATLDVWAVEVKTAVADTARQRVLCSVADHGRVVVAQWGDPRLDAVLGSAADGTVLSHKQQILHHAATLGVSGVVYVRATLTHKVEQIVFVLVPAWARQMYLDLLDVMAASTLWFAYPGHPRLRELGAGDGDTHEWVRRQPWARRGADERLGTLPRAVLPGRVARAAASCGAIKAGAYVPDITTLQVHFHRWYALRQYVGEFGPCVGGAKVSNGHAALWNRHKSGVDQTSKFLSQMRLGQPYPSIDGFFLLRVVTLLFHNLHKLHQAQAYRAYRRRTKAPSRLTLRSMRKWMSRNLPASRWRDEHLLPAMEEYLAVLKLESQQREVTAAAAAAGNGGMDNGDGGGGGNGDGGRRIQQAVSAGGASPAKPKRNRRSGFSRTAALVQYRLGVDVRHRHGLVRLEKQRWCAMCTPERSSSVEVGQRHGGRRTLLMCSSCEVPLCASNYPCNRLWHTVADLRTVTNEQLLSPPAGLPVRARRHEIDGPGPVVQLAQRMNENSSDDSVGGSAMDDDGAAALPTTRARDGRAASSSGRPRKRPRH